MILVFGGTTEGRKAVEVLEEAGSLYYYSTRSDGQQVELLNGIHLTGKMEVTEMVACCQEHGIRLIIDAAHPFAEELHRNLLVVSKHIGAPIVRYDRIYPEHDADLVWCKDYDDAVRQLEANHVERLLALTGVNTIGKLQQYWKHPEHGSDGTHGEHGSDDTHGELKHDCWFRILNRQASKSIAMANHFPEERLVYYETDETSALIRQLRPDAIITKESGLSGGFTEKVEAARQADVKVFVVERPVYASQSLSHYLVVNGPHGLRRAVEKLLPEFFPLHSGLTTGTCATAAAVAATIRLTTGETPEEVPVLLPNGETISVVVGYADDTPSPAKEGSCCAYCVKEAGDDPDVTDGIKIRATVNLGDGFMNLGDGSINLEDGSINLEDGPQIKILGGEGVGRFTLPGFDYPPGEPAINKGPRAMIRQNLERLITPLHSGRGRGRVFQEVACRGVVCTINVPGGEEIARRTFNPRLGIEGGISIIGVSGIVKPFSEEAFIASIRKCVEVALASGTDRIVINSGGKSERFVKALYPTLPQQALVEYGNYIGETLKNIAALSHQPSSISHHPSALSPLNVTLGVMLGKAVKLAQGHLDTHSKRATMDKDFIRQMLDETHCDIDISHITLARELWDMLPDDKKQPFASVVISHCLQHCRPLLPNGHLTILLIDDEGNVYAE